MISWFCPYPNEGSKKVVLNKHAKVFIRTSWPFLSYNCYTGDYRNLMFLQILCGSRVRADKM